jgi:protein involved in polysaccharide export with SLBB domain
MGLRRFISLLLVFLILLPPTQGWSQKLEDQAEFYLQNIGPQQGTGQITPSRQLGTQPTTPQTQIPAFRPELPVQKQPLQALPQILTTAPRQMEEISGVERRAWTQKMFLKQFGYSFFYQAPASFLPVQTVPVGPDYIIGPGDTVRIVVWGSVDGEYNIRVGRDGQLDIPKVGVVHVSSLSFRQLREVLDREFSRQYTNFQMNVTLDNLRTITVYVVGQARFPGSYAVSSLSTLISALFAASGPSKSGSLRNIELRRGAKVVSRFDMYDFLLRGDKSKDLRLQAEDVIFIPPIGPLVAVGTPKSFREIEEGIKSLARLQLEEDHAKLQMREEKTSTQGQGLTWRQREDIKILSGVTPDLKLEERELEEKFKEKEQEEKALFKSSPKSWMEQQTQREEVRFEKRYGMSLQEAYDKLIRSKLMEVGGPVKVPGVYELKGERTLSDLLKLAGGLGDIAFKGRVQVYRVQGRQEMVLFDENLEKVSHGYRDLQLSNGDFVKIFPVPEQVEKKVVIAGAVKTPGEFGFHDNMRVKDLIDYAGGCLQQADRSEAEITRVTLDSQGPQTTRIYFKLFGALNGSPRDNLILRSNDYLFVRTVPDWDIYKTVKVEGEVKSPGTYAIKKGETLSSVLTRAGGLTGKAYPLGTVLTRVSAKEIQRQQLKASIDRLEAEMIALAGSKMTTGDTSEESKSAEGFFKSQKQMIASLRKIEPMGRVIIHVDDPERLRGTPDDIELQEGDTLTIPTVPQTINIVGAVFNPTAIVYAPNRTVREYLTIAGGATKIADDKEIYVIKVNGAAVSRRGFKMLGASWDGTKYVYQPGGLNSLPLDPGDTIIVPEKLDRVPWLKPFKDVATILGQIAVTAGVALIALR